MNRKTTGKPQGQIRQSQIITTFGPGAMLDLPKHSVLVAGLDHWRGMGDEIIEPRLTEKLKVLLDVPALKLYAPPPDQEDPTAPPTGINAWQFPEWFIVQDVEPAEPAATVRSRMLVHRKALVRGKYLDENRKRRPVVSVRFVRACRGGHVGDIDWYTFVHGGPTECRRQLWIDERGTSGDLSEVWIRCECGKAQRSVGDAAMMQTMALGNCDGSRPWLGPYTKEQCGEPNRLLIRTASNAYFPQLMSVISLPDRDETVKKAVDAAWEFVEEVEDIDQLRYERKKAKVKAALEGLVGRRGLHRDPRPPRCGAGGGQVGEAGRVGNADGQQGRGGQRRAGRLLLRPGRAAREVGRPLDAVDRAGRGRPPAARSDGPGGLHAVRGGLAGHRGRTGDRRPPGRPGTGDHLAAGRREPGRGDLPPVQARRRGGMVAAAGRLAAGTAG